MKAVLLLAATLAIGSTSQARDKFFPSGTYSLINADQPSNKRIWMGGEAARAIFEQMYDVPAQQTETGGEARFGKNIQCLHEAANTEVTYSCVIEIESTTGVAVSK